MYRLTKRKPEKYENILYYKNEYLDVDTAVRNTVVSIVDDKNIPGETLSRRRLKLKSQGAPLYPLRRAIFFLGDFIKMAKSGYWFIDSYGNLFTYTKSTRVPLRFRKIKKIIPTKTTGSIIEVEGIPQRFKTLFRVDDRVRFAGILEHRGMYILYDVYHQQYKDTWRMI